MHMASFMFWNVKKTSDPSLIAAACREHRVDVAMLAECEVPSANLVAAINRQSTADQTYYEVASLAVSLRFVTRFPVGSISPVSDDRRLTILHLKPPVGTPTLIVVVHVPSKLWLDSEDQYMFVRGLRKQIEDAELRIGHQNTFVIGDMNLDPFENAMVAADGFHAMMDKKIVIQKNGRKFADKLWTMFYNPMWSRMGDDSNGPPGTYFYSRGGAIDYMWHTFDQVLLRPDLLKFFDHSRLHVLTEIAGTSLLSRLGLSSHSDHLPIVVGLEIERFV